MFSPIEKIVEWIRSGGEKEKKEIVKAMRYLDRTHPTMIKRGTPILGAREEFRFQETSQNGEYTRYHFSEGTDTRVIYVVLCEEEREKIIQLFSEKMREHMENNNKQFHYKDSMKGMFIGNEVRHRFFSSGGKEVAFMSDEGKIEIWLALMDEDIGD